ncbi:MAG TPA: pinensin family lanthipeptide [Longimicrobium sp.]
MKKLNLSLEELSVESFATTLNLQGVGTVHGRDASEGTDCWSVCGGAFCSWDCHAGTGPYCNTAAVTCEYGPTMNPMDTNCLDATMAGETCNGADTCYDTCPI